MKCAGCLAVLGMDDAARNKNKKVLKNVTNRDAYFVIVNERRNFDKITKLVLKKYDKQKYIFRCHK